MRSTTKRFISSCATGIAILSASFGLRAQTIDVTEPGDPITPSSANSPGAEGAANAIDNNTATKYLNFDILNTGFTVTPSHGPRSILTGIGLTSANDAPERDPASYTLECSVDGTTWTLISSGTVPLFSGRFVRQEIDFANTAAFAKYRVTFPTVANPGTANSMQIGEVELLGSVTNPPQPILLTASPRRNPNAIYLTFTHDMGSDALTASHYAVDNSVVVTGAAYGSSSNVIVLNVSTTPMTLGTTYNVTISGVHGADGSAIDPDPTVGTFVFGAGITRAALTIKRFDNIGGGNVSDLTGSPLFPCTPAYTDTGAPNMEYGTNPAHNNNGQPDTDNYGTWIYGMFVAPTTGNYIFAMASDDGGALYLSTDADPAHKVQLTAMPAWDGDREFVAPTGSGQTPAPLSAPQSLVAGQAYYLEVLQKEGGGGDHVNVAVQKPGDPAISNGQAPIDASLFQSNFWANCGRTPFTYFGNVSFAVDIASKSVLEADPVNYYVRADGSPDYSYQWYSNNVAIPGATGQTISFTARPSANGATFYAVVNNQFSSATSTVSTLTVIPVPRILDVGSRGDANAVYVAFTKPINSTDAQNLANYTVSDNFGALPITSATFLGGSNQTVKLSLGTPLQLGSNYTAVIQNIHDTSGNVQSPNPATVPFVHGAGINAPLGLVMKRYDGQGSMTTIKAAIASCATPSRNNPSIPTMEYGTNPSLNNSDGNTDNYGTWMYGIFVPPTTGNYQFALSSDDDSQLWFSSDANPANKVMLTSQAAWNGQREYVLPTGSGQTPPALPAPITLQAGQGYYLEVLHHEGGGGDHVTVAVRKPGDPAIANGQTGIPSSLFGQYYSFGCPPSAFFKTLGPIALTSQPQNTTVGELSPATFAVALDGVPPYSVQWYSNNVAIPGATATRYSFSPLRDANGAQYKAIVQNGFSAQTSSVATLTVIVDSTPPALVRAVGSRTFTNVTVVFSEPVAVSSAQNLANYSITNDAGVALSIVSATVRDNTNVVLKTAQQPTNTHYTVVVNNVTDRAGVPNTIAANSTASFTSFAFTPGFVLMEVYRNIPNSDVASLTSSPKYPNYPDERYYIQHLDSRDAYPTDAHETYGGRISGLFIPPTNGNYTIYLRSDDASQFFGSTDDQVSHETLLTQETGCCNPFTSHSVNVGALVGGNRYAADVLWKEGTGGDYAQVSIDATSVVPPSMLGMYANPDETTLTIVQAPNNATSYPNAIVTFTVTASNSAAYPQNYQWQSGDGAGGFTNIVGATSSTLTYGPLVSGDNGAIFRVQVVTPGHLLYFTATLTVQPDTTPPTLLSAKQLDGTFRNMLLTYTEPMNTNDGTLVDPLSYTIYDSMGNPLGLDYTVAITSSSNVVISLTSGTFDENTVYGFQACCGVNDANGNQVDPANFANARTWVRSRGFAKWDFYLNTPGTTMAQLFAAPTFPNSPDVTFFTNSTAWPQSNPNMDNYGLRMSGYFRPPVDGNYAFYIQNDDDARFRLSTDDTAANLVTVVDVACCNGSFAGGNVVSGLVAGNYYYFEAYMKEGGGGDYLILGVKPPGASAPSVMDASMLMSALPVNATAGAGIATQPQNATTIESHPATFSITVTNTGSLTPFVQWQSDASGPFADIAGASGLSYTTGPLPLSANGRRYRAVVYLPSQTIVSASATVTVLADTNPPVLLSAASANGTQIGVKFTELLDATTASDVNNYAVDGAHPATATLRADGSNVILTVAGSVGSEFTLTASNVTDVATTPNRMATTTVIGKYWVTTVTDIGGPNPAGTHFSGAEGQIEISSGGNDVWGTGPDQFTFAYTPHTGDFDVKARVDSLQYVGSPWTKGGINIRESTDPASRMFWFYPTPLLGSAAFEGAIRVDNGGDVSDFGEPRPAAFYPAWLRAIRSGGQFSAYISPDGTNWTQFGTSQDATPFPATLLVGIGLVSHVDGTAATGKFSEFSDTHPTLKTTESAGTLTLHWDGSGILQYSDDIPATTWTSLPSATSPYTVSTTLAHRYYRVQRVFPSP